MAELISHADTAEAEEPVVTDAAKTEGVAMGAEAVMDGQQITAIDRIETATIDGIDAVPSLTGKSPEKNTKRAGVREPDAGARTPALETSNSAVSSCHHEVASSHPTAHAMTPVRPTLPATTVMAEAEEAGWDDVDMAFELIPQAEQSSWLERAQQTLREQGTPWLETCVPVVKALAFKLWGLGIPVYPEAVSSSP